MVIHPQSIVHSLVELADGSVIAQLGVTDMRLPIQYACSYPDRWDALLPSLDLTRAGRLEFFTPDSRALPLPRAGVSRAAGGRDAAGGPECRQRDRRRGISRREARLYVHSWRDRADDERDTPSESVSTLETVRSVDSWARDLRPRVAGELELTI